MRNLSFRAAPPTALRSSPGFLHYPAKSHSGFSRLHAAVHIPATSFPRLAEYTVLTATSLPDVIINEVPLDAAAAEMNGSRREENLKLGLYTIVDDGGRLPFKRPEHSLPNHNLG